jgi:hypothetical protein
MNDDTELMTAVRESVTGVHTATPVDEIVKRGRALRARRARRVPGVAGVLAAAAAAALAVNALVPGGGQHPGGSSSARLAAWTVVRQSDGTVEVTIHQMRDPAGLQKRLRVDGVPATVTFAGRMNRSCHLYRVGTEKALNRVFTSKGSGTVTLMIIHPKALPPGAGVAINPPAQPSINVEIGLVRTSPSCTGT